MIDQPREFHIPLYRPWLTPAERSALFDAFDSSWVSAKGPYGDRFETDFARLIGVDHAVSCSSGTTALHLALLGCGIGPGDEVIVPALTFVATANAVTYCGADPIFADVDPITWQIDPRAVAQVLTARTRAILAVHLYGWAAPMRELQDLADAHDLWLIEDCAEALGTRIESRSVGSIGDVAAFSFFGNKTITTGEGGMVVTSNAAIAQYVRHLRGHAQVAPGAYDHDAIGYNYRLTNLQAALGVAQLLRLPEILTAKRQVMAAYRHYFGDVAGVRLHDPLLPVVTPSYWLVNVLVGCDQRDALRSTLAAAGIETRPIFTPIPRLRPYRDCVSGPIGTADQISRRGLSLPSFPTLTEGEIAYVADRLCEAVRA